MSGKDYPMKHLNVLMATMGLDLGGAETHIVELSKELQRQGYHVSVISNGGVYVDELSACGIPHFSAPLNQRSPKALIRSFFALNRTLRSVRPDVVHAHARIPAFLCSILCKFYGIPFVTTAHFNFKTGGGLAAMSRWGCRSIAVSEDLKRYLVENYGLNPNHISVTINGISTEKFSPDADDGTLRGELSLPQDAKVILTVSRMDHNACEAAFKLIAAAPAIHAADPNTRIVVVGSGDALDEIRAAADACNSKLGLPYIICTGGRTDINRFCAMCTVFVGVSRAALEAMSCGKPAVLAGNQGFLGTYTPEKLSDCIKTNFTCRDIPYPAGDAIGREVCALLAMDDAARDEIGAVGRKLIFDSYSVGRMAADAAAVYQEVQYFGRKKYDYLIGGYYGYHNAGDEALLRAVQQSLLACDPNLRFCVLTRHPEQARDTSVTPIERFSYFAVRRAIRRSRAMLFGGGTLIQDATSTKSLFYYLWLLRSGERAGLRTMLYANGIGPIYGSFSRRCTAGILNRVDIITLREPGSLELLRELGVTAPHIEVTADEVLTLFDDHIPVASSDYIAVSLRDWHTLSPDFADRMAAALDQISERSGLPVHFIPMQSETDLMLCRTVAKKLHVRNAVCAPASTEQSIALISGSTLVIGMRLHALVFAAGAAVPSIGIIYDPKITGFLDHIGIHSAFPCEDIDPAALADAACAMLADRDSIRATLQLRAAELRSAAHRNAELAVGLLGSRRGDVL